MDNALYFDFAPIFALATPFGKSALAVFRTSGEGTFELFRTIFSNKKAFDNVKSPKVAYGFIVDKDTKEKIDEVVLTIYPKGHGYTKEEAVEVSSHGSIAVIKALNLCFEKAGFRKAEGGEFSFRAFSNGAVTLTEAEAVLDLIESTNEKTRAFSLKSREGFIDERIKVLYEKLLHLSSLFELQLDYSEDEYDEDISYPKVEVDEVKNLLLHLQENYTISNVLKGGLNVAFVGDTNAGKSTLFNILLNSNRSIVSSEKGTTRDYIKETVEIDGYTINLFDTAGLNSDAIGIEAEGISRTSDILSSSDIILHLISLEHSKDEIDKQLSEYMSTPKCKVINILTKEDKLTSRLSDSVVVWKEQGAMPFSATTKEGLFDIIRAIKSSVNDIDASTKDGEFMLLSQTTLSLVKKASDALEMLNEHTPIEASSSILKEAISPIAVLLGKENVTDDVLTSLFSRFCVGK